MEVKGEEISTNDDAMGIAFAVKGIPSQIQRSIG
jgi:hypothetical protein